MDSRQVTKPVSSSRFRKRWGRNVSALFVAIVAIGSPAAADQIVSRKTPHLTFVASVSPDAVPAAGGRVSLLVHIIPNRKMHVYAPGSTYRAVSIALERNPVLKPSKTTYPKPSIFFFQPLKEQVPVYSEPFDLKMTIAVSAIARQSKQVKLRGTLSYQACDDRVCYLPESVPLEWTLPVQR
jgi:hypothetical protein